MVDYYQILEVSRTASASEIKASYKRLTMKYHPDHNPNNPYAEDYFKRITEAYRVLGDNNRKYLYDLGLAIPTPAKTYSYAAQDSYGYAPEMSKDPYVNSYAPENMVSKAMRIKIAIFTVLFCGVMVLAGVWFNAYMNDRSAKILLNEAKAFYKEKGQREALLKIGHALGYDAHCFEAYALRAQIHTEMLNYYKAIEDYEFILEHHKKMTAKEKTEYRFLRGVCYFKGYAFSSASADFEYALQQDPQQLKYQFYHAAASLKNGGKPVELCPKMKEAFQAGIREAADLIQLYCSE